MQLLIRLYHVLTTSERWRLLMSLVLLLATAASEVLLVSLVGPIIEWFQSTQALGNTRAHPIVPIVGAISSEVLVLALVGAAALRYVMKIASSTSERRFRQTVSQRLTDRYFVSLTNQDTKPVPSKARTDIANLRQIADLVFDPLLRIFAEVITSTLLLLLLFSRSLVAAVLVIAISAFATSVVGPMMMRTSHRIGARARELDVHSTRLADDVVEFHSEIRLFRVHDFFVARFRPVNQTLIKVRSRLNQIYALLPATIEFLAVVVIFAVVVSIQSQEGMGPTAVAQLALFAVVLIRIVPAIGTIYSAMVRLRYGVTQLPEESGFGRIPLDPRTVQTSDAKTITDSLSSIEFSNVSLIYPGGNKPLLTSLSFVIGIGEVVGLVGESGIGKSSLGKIAIGLLEPTSGSVTGRTRDNGLLSISQLRRGYVPQIVPLVHGTLRDNILLGRDNLQTTNLDLLITRLGLSEVDRRTVDDPDVVLQLSGGQRQRVGIARAIVNDPELLVLDEVTSSLDAKSEAEIVALLAGLTSGRATLFITHKRKLLSSFTTTYELRNGNLTHVRI